MKSLRRFTLMTALLAAGAGPARAAGQPLDEERLINVESPHTVGFHKWRFDFQHGFSSGESFSPRLPIADLSLTYGLSPDLQAKLEGLFNNSRVRGGGQEARSEDATYEVELQRRLLNQSAGAPVSFALSAAYEKSWYSRSFNGTVISRGMYQAWGGKAILSRTFGRFAQSAVWKAMGFNTGPGSGDQTLAALMLGERFNVLSIARDRYDLIGDFTVAQDPGELGFKKAWGAGVQFVAGSPHTITLYVSNIAGETLTDSIYAYKGGDRFFTFRWSYRF